MNAYEKLQAHHAVSKYARGCNKGHAPLGKRTRTSELVVRLPDRMVVRLYGTDIISATPDGCCTLSAGPWHTSPSTRNAMELGLHVAGLRGRLESRRPHGVTQTWLRTPHGAWPFADGMKIDSEGRLLGGAAVIKAKRIDRVASLGLIAGVKQSGFKDMFKLLFATVPAPENAVQLPPSSLADVLTNADYAELWPSVVQKYAFARRYNPTIHNWGFARVRHKKWDPERGTFGEYGEVLQTPEQCWARIMAACKKRMYVEVGVTENF